MEQKPESFTSSVASRVRAHVTVVASWQQKQRDLILFRAWLPHLFLEEEGSKFGMHGTMILPLFYFLLNTCWIFC